MSELSASTKTILRVCKQLSSDSTQAVGEVMAAAAMVAVNAGLDDDQALSALTIGLKAVREAAEDARAH